MRFDVITLFPELFGPMLEAGVTRRAFGSGGPVQIKLWQLRDFAEGQYRRVDDRPFGGGPGMVMQAEPLWQCLQAIRADRADPAAGRQAPVVLFSPVGKPLNHGEVQRWADAESPGAILVCGRYEGVDQRFVDACVDEQISLGDFVLSGGEIPAMALLDAVPVCNPACCRMPTATRRTASIRRWADCLTARITPGPNPGRAGACPRCCSAATTPPLRSGGRPSACI